MEIKTFLIAIGIGLMIFTVIFFYSLYINENLREIEEECNKFEAKFEPVPEFTEEGYKNIRLIPLDLKYCEICGGCKK